MRQTGREKRNRKNQGEADFEREREREGETEREREIAEGKEGPLTFRSELWNALASCHNA